MSHSSAKPWLRQEVRRISKAADSDWFAEPWWWRTRVAGHGKGCGATGAVRIWFQRGSRDGCKLVDAWESSE
jgi:hypothetical protein